MVMGDIHYALVCASVCNKRKVRSKDRDMDACQISQ